MDSKTPQVPEKQSRVYAKPEFRKYGHLTQVTSALGGTVGKNDGGGGPDKTGFG
jgi:hypothetical protein